MAHLHATSVKICFLSSMHSPADKRVYYKEARTLSDAGYRVVHLAPNDGTERPDGRIKLITYHAGRTLRQRIAALWQLYRRAAAIEADIYHCNEVDSWLVGVLLKLVRRRLVVFDVHEHYPSTFGRLHCPPAFAWYASHALRAVYRLLTPVTDGFVYAKETVAQDFPHAKRKSVVVRNFATLEEPATGMTSANNGSITAIHLGVFGKVRGWPQLMEAMKLVRNEKLRVKVIGSVNDGSEPQFREVVSASHLRDRVKVYDWMPYKEAIAHVAGADIGLVLFQPGIENHVYAMPHKMFDYMIAGLPVIIPKFAVEVAPIVENERCGILVDPSKPNEIAEALETLAGDAALRRAYGENGRRAVLREYNWEREGARLVEFYGKLARRVPRLRRSASASVA